MPIFDRATQKVVVRIVYDGPAFAGKTTNLEQIRGFFTIRRRSELFTAGDRAGRTLFFDWLQLEGGLVAGYPLRCQLVTVPGQGVLSHRRRRLLAQCDAAVFVCESSRSGVGVGRAMLRSLQTILEEQLPRHVPLVVQANKQDVPDAIDLAAMARALDLSSCVPILGASASKGQGVRETLVLAIRAAADLVQRELLSEGASTFLGEAGTPLALYESMLAVEEPSSSGVSRAAVAIDALAPALADSGAVSGPAMPETGVIASEPGLPTADVATGSVWPPNLGREILRDIARQTGPDAHPVEGPSGAFCLRVGDFLLRTAKDRAYENPDDGRAAMLRIVRRLAALGSLIPARTVVCLQRAGSGASWIWILSPILTTLEHWIERAVAVDDGPFLGEALATLADAQINVMRAMLRTGLRLDIRPSRLGISGGVAVVEPADFMVGDPEKGVGEALLATLELEQRHPGPVRAYAERLTVGFSALGTEGWSSASHVVEELRALAGRQASEHVEGWWRALGGQAS